MSDETATPGKAVSEAPRPDSKRRLWIALAMAVAIFVAGMATGAVAVVWVAINRIQYALEHPELVPAQIASTLQSRLELDDDQRAKVEQIFAGRQSRLSGARQQLQPLIVFQLNQLRDEVGAVLTDGQRERWTKMFDELVDRWLPPKAPAEISKATSPDASGPQNTL